MKVMEWYALFVRPNHEHTVSKRLVDKGFETYLPLFGVRRKTKRGEYLLQRPLLPRYVFVRCYLEMYMHLKLISDAGVVRIIENAEGAPLVLPEKEIDLLKRLVGASEQNIALSIVPYVMVGHGMEVLEGSLVGLAGFFKEPGTLVVSMHSLKVSIAVGPNLVMEERPAF